LKIIVLCGKICCEKVRNLPNLGCFMKKQAKCFVYERNDKMKKILCTVIVAVISLGLFACGNENTTEDTTNPAQASEQTTPVISDKDNVSDKEFFEPENGVLKAGTFEVQIAEDIADRVVYTSSEASVDIYFKEDKVKLCSISADTSVYRLIVGPESAWILGDAEEYQELNVHVQGVLGQVCVLKGSQNTCPKEMIVGEDGRVHGSMMTDYYETYEEMLKIEKRMYYLLELSDAKQLNNGNNKSEYTEIRSSLLKNSKIVE